MNDVAQSPSETSLNLLEIEKARSTSSLDNLEVEACDASWNELPDAFSKFVFGTSTVEEFACSLREIYEFTKIRFGKDCFAMIAGFSADSYRSANYGGTTFDVSTDYATACCVQWLISIFGQMDEGKTAAKSVSIVMREPNIKTLLRNLSEADQGRIAQNVIYAADVIQRGEIAPTCFQCGGSIDVANFRNASCKACHDRGERERSLAGFTLADQLEDARFASLEVLRLHARFADVATQPSMHADSADDVFLEFKVAMKMFRKAMTAPVVNQISKTNLDRSGICGSMTMGIVMESKWIVDDGIIALRKGGDLRLRKYYIAGKCENDQCIRLEFNAAIKGLSVKPPPIVTPNMIPPDIRDHEHYDAEKQKALNFKSAPNSWSDVDDNPSIGFGRTAIVKYAKLTGQIVVSATNSGPRKRN